MYGKIDRLFATNLIERYQFYDDTTENGENSKVKLSSNFWDTLYFDGPKIEFRFLCFYPHRLGFHKPPSDSPSVSGIIRVGDLQVF